MSSFHHIILPLYFSQRFLIFYFRQFGCLNNISQLRDIPLIIRSMNYVCTNKQKADLNFIIYILRKNEPFTHINCD